jgi:hypothetical protein
VHDGVDDNEIANRLAYQRQQQKRVVNVVEKA